MDIFTRISESDWFNYYLAGFVWLGIGVFINPKAFGQVQPVLGNPVVAIVLLAIVPYLLGISLSPFSEMVARWKRPPYIKAILGDAGSPRKENQFCLIWSCPPPTMLVKSLREQALAQAESILGVEVQNKTLYFWWMQAYIWQFDNGAVQLARRAKAMRNLLESLLLPVPLFVLTLIRYVVVQAAPSLWWLG